MAKWRPLYDQISHTFTTDANGFELMERPVYKLGSDANFAKSFFPVDSSITMSNYEETKAFTVWNDRPQGGSVHSDKSITLLVQRYVNTKDNGGLP